MTQVLLKNRSIKWLVVFGLLLGAYLVWANVEQIQYVGSASAVTDFHDPRRLVGFAEAVFVGRVVEQVGADESDNPFPRTQFRVEVLQSIKSVRKVNQRSFNSLPAKPVDLPAEVIVDQYGAHTRDASGKRTLVLMDGQPLLVPGQTYVLGTLYDPERDWYHVLPEGAGLTDSEDKLTKAVEKFKKAKDEEIPFEVNQQ